jgi:hypothetical protein
VLTYRVRMGAGSLSGNGINTAQAGSGAVSSNISSVRVQVVGGVFSNKAYVIGKVFADCSRDGVQDAGEPGIPGVRIYLEDGTYAVTDEEGKYSFYGLEPRTHVAKVDNITLPAGATLAVLNNRNAFDGGSRFVDTINGELHKADFAIAECTPDIHEADRGAPQGAGQPLGNHPGCRHAAAGQPRRRRGRQPHAARRRCHGLARRAAKQRRQQRRGALAGHCGEPGRRGRHRRPRRAECAPAQPIYTPAMRFARAARGARRRGRPGRTGAAAPGRPAAGPERRNRFCRPGGRAAAAGGADPGPRQGPAGRTL